MKRMLINATHAEELRVALVDGQRLYDLDIEIPSKRQYKSNIYKGKITKIEPSLEAAFVDYGMPRQGFLPIKDVAPQYYNGDNAGSSKPNIADVLKKGQELLVQVEKEERGNKGAALTTFISLPGRFLVLMPNNPGAGGISRRVEGEDRKNLREALKNIESPENAGVIARTAGIGKNEDELRWDLEYLHKLWLAIDQAWQSKPAPFLVYQDNDVIIRTLRDYLSPEIEEILTDDTVTYNNTMAFMQQVMPNHAEKLKLYSGSTPLFSHFRIESQIEKAFHREVNLRSGGSIVIDATEALVAIDINSARATKGGDIEETALNTNLEAADEIARQLRLRDLGGLIVIDFIDMLPARNIKEVENRLREVVKQDRARIQIGKISRFGLMEMSRQRLRPALAEQHQMPCPTCNGQGILRSADSLAISILRQLEEELIKQKAEQMVIQLPIDVATFILNEKRNTISLFEARYKTHLVIIPNKTLRIPEFHFKRINKNEGRKNTASYAQQEEYNKKAPSLDDITGASPQSADTPMVQGISVDRGQLPKEQKQEQGLIKRLFSSLFSTDTTETSAKPATNPKQGNRSSGKSSTPRKHAKSSGNGQRKNTANRNKTNTSQENNNKKSQGRNQKKNKPQEQKAEQTGKQKKTKKTEQGNTADNNNRRPRRRPRSSNNGNSRAKKPEERTKKAVQSDSPDSKTAQLAPAPLQPVQNNIIKHQPDVTSSATESTPQKSEEGHKKSSEKARNTAPATDSTSDVAAGHKPSQDTDKNQSAQATRQDAATNKSHAAEANKPQSETIKKAEDTSAPATTMPAETSLPTEPSSKEAVNK